MKCETQRFLRPFELVIVVYVLSIGCNPAHKATKPDQIKIQASESFSRQGQGVQISEWWRELGADELDSLVKKAALDNLDVQQTKSRIAQAQASVRIANAGFLPSVTMTADASKNRSVNPFFGAQTINRFGLSAAASYELDVWDRVGATKRAAVYESEAVKLDLKALQMSLSAQVAETWIALIEQRATLKLIERQLKTNTTLLELVELRFSNGLSQAADVLQQKQQLLATRSLLPPIRARKATLEHQLALLLGKAPQQGSVLGGKRLNLPTPSALPALGLPSQLLMNRPDLVAARTRVAAADERVGAAIADRLPSFRIQATTGFGSLKLVELFDAWVWSLAGSVVGTVFDGGRRAAEVDRNRAVLKGLLSNFRGQYLKALKEVEDALVLEEQEAIRCQRLTEELEITRRVMKETQARYVEGVGDYLPVIAAVQAEQRTERSLVSAQRTRLSHRIQLYRALGGSWISKIAPKGVSGEKR